MSEKIVTSCNFFCSKSCNFFFAVMRLTGLHDLPQKEKNTGLDDFFVTRISRKKKYTDYNIHITSVGAGHWHIVST